MADSRFATKGRFTDFLRSPALDRAQHEAIKSARVRALGRRSLKALTRKCTGMAGSWLHGMPLLIDDKRLVPI
jgi:hypothetical protein